MISLDRMLRLDIWPASYEYSLSMPTLKARLCAQQLMVPWAHVHWPQYLSALHRPRMPTAPAIYCRKLSCLLDMQDLAVH